MANAWEKAVKEYKSSGGGNQKSSGSSGGSAWQKAVDEYKQYDRDAYRSTGQQRISQRKEQERQFEFESTFNKEANDFWAAARRDLTTNNGFNAADFFEERKRQADALKKKADTIALYLNDHMDSYTPESYDSNMQYLSQFNTQVDDILAQYQPSIDSKTGMRAYEDELRAAMERNDQMRTNQQSALFAFDPSQPTGFFDKLQQYTDDQSYRSVTDKWTDEERYELGRLQMEDPAKAAEFAANVNSYHNALATEPERQKIREQAAQNLWKNTGKALLASTFSAQDQFMDRMAEYAARGQTTEKDYVTPWDYAQETTGAISQKLNENAIGSDRYNEISGIMQEGLKGNGVDPFYRNQDSMQTANDMFEGRGIGDLYNLGYSMAQNTLSRYSFGAIPGVGEAATLANYFASAATSGIDEARRMGADGDQAVTSGIAKGTWEVATEVLGLDNLYKMGPAITWGDLFKQLGVQGLFEAFGEGANSALGYLSDYYILGDLSEYAQSVQNYIEQGETEETARRKAFLDAAKNVGFEALSGAVSGWVSGGIETGYKTGLENQYYRNVNPQALIDLGMTAGEDTAAFKLAQQMQGQIAKGQKPSGNEKRVLAYNIDLMNLAAQKVDAEMAAANMTAEQIEEMKPTTSEGGNARQISRNESVNVDGFAEVKDGKSTVKTDSGTVDYSDVSFGTEKQGNQYFAVESLPLLDTEHANKLLHTIQEADAGNDTTEVMGIREAYRLGYMGATTQELRGSDANVLPIKLQDQIYSIGQEQRTANDAVRATVKAVPTKATGKYKKVIIEGKLSKLNGKRKAEIAYMDRVADEFAGTAVHVYESYKKNGKMYYRDNSGKEQLAPNGKYVNGEIWVDLNSGDKGEGLVLNTFAHEMYHHIEEQNKPKARELAEFVVKELGLETVDKAVQKQIDKARAAGYGEKYFQDKQGMTAEQARNEVYMRAMSDFVADSLETMFTRGDPAKAIANLKKENQGLFDQIKAFIDEWISKVKKFYSDKTISEEGAMVAQLEKFEQLQQMFMEAMQGTGENYRNALKNPVQNKKQDDVAQFSNRLSGQITEQDQKYLDAINRGDMDAAQRMVEDAAREAGYDSPKLYHGTNSFGFTKFDPQKADDRISIFATSNSQVAETYSGETARRKISEKATITPEALESASPQELLKLLQENISKEYRIVSDAERSQIIEANRKPLLEAARSIENLYVINMDMFDSAKKDALFAVSGILRDMAKAEKYSDLMDKKMSYDDALWDLRWMDDSLTDEVISAIGNKENLAFRELTKWLDKTMFHADSEYSKANGTPWMNSVEAVNELYPRLFKGVYELYGRTGNAFEMMADGANWNQLDGSKIGQYGPVRTRDVSRYAYDSGYDSVIFRDIRDNADYTYSGNSDVYVFFGSNMLKSADTVTYDDDGNVIPLSERFNPEIDDVRYSTRNSNLTSNRYWYPAMKKSEIAEVKNLAKHEAKSTDNYLGIGVKWLYNNKKGHRYFALYSTADENSPTVLYACKGDQAEFEHDLLLDFVESERGLNESLNRGSTTIDRLFDSVRNAANRKNVSSDRTLGAGSNTRNVSENSRNRREKASPAFENCLRNLTQVQAKYGVNDDSTRNSLRNQQPTTREILYQIDISTRKKNEAHFLGQYQENLSNLAEQEPRLEELNAQIKELYKDQKGNLKEISRLQKEQRQVNADANRLKRLVNAFERSDMGKRLVSEYKLKEQKRQAKEIRKDFKAEQKELIQTMQSEQRAIREELTGKISDITLMEREFIRLAKKYEQLDTRTGKSSIKDAKAIAQLKADLKAEAKSHKEDSKIWEREFNRLLTDYETAGRQIARLEATIARQRATAKARVEGRRKTEMRHKIQRKVNELDHLLRHGTKHRNVPEFLQDSVAAVLQAINMEVRDGEQRRKTYEATIARYDRQIAAATDPETVSRLIEKRNEYAAKGDQFANRMDTLQKAYEQIRKENTGLELDEGIAEHLNTLFETVGDTPLGQMTAEQLDAVNDILNVTMATVRNANEMLAEARSAGVVESSKSAIMEIKSAGETKKKKTRLRKNLEQFGWNNLKPVYAFDVIGSKTLTDRYEALRKGEDTLAVDLNEAKEFFREQWKKNGGKEWDMEQKWKFISTSGKSFELDLNQIMSLYALAKDKDARSHLRVGGFAFDSDYQTKEDINIGPVKISVKVESTDASAYNLSDEILGEIISKLTPQQRAFADAMQAYLSDTMAAKGNEVSLKKYGIRLFKKKDYFPIRVADQFMAKAREQQAGDRKLKDSGFTKDRKPEAKNPVVLSGFTEIWAEHVDEMSLYHSFVLPLDDFNRVLNYHDAFVEGEQAASVVEAITNAFGKGAVNYIDQLIKDVNGGIKGGSTVSFANSMMSKAKKAQTMASLSVAIQQPSSIIRAMSEVDTKYFYGPRVTEKSHDRTWDEIKKHAPIAVIKEMGGYDTNVGKSTVDYLTDTADYDGFGEKFKAMFTDEKFRDDALGRLPALMDEMTWGVIWNAVKREQRDRHPNMDTKSDAFMKLVTNRFTEVITRTQVYDSVFSRSGLMRDRKSDLAKMTTSFMAEPTTTANMLAVSILQATRGDIKGKQAAKTVGSIVASLALNAALVSVIYALRDDDEDKRYDEKYVENFRNNFFESLNPVGYIPYVRDIYNVVVKGYDVERADMELYGDFENALRGLYNDDLTAWEKTENVIGAIGNLLGVPVKNILRDVKGFVQTLGFAWDDRPNPKTKTGTYMAWRGIDLNDKEQMILAIQRGDEEHLQRVFGRFDSQQQAESALQSAIKAKYLEDGLTAEETEEMLNTYFDRDDEHEIYWIMEEWDYAKANDGSTDGYTKYGGLYEAIETGDFESEIARFLEHGADASTIRSQITKEYRKQYMADETAREDIREKLRPVYEATGMYADDIEDKFNDWDFEAEYGMTYGEFKAEYREGLVTETQMREAMKSYGLMQYEIAEGIRDLNDEIKFVNKYDMTLTEMKDAYDHGDVSRNQMTNALVFSGKTQTEAREWVTERDIENRLGIEYAKLDDAYKHGDISRTTLRNAIIEHGETPEKADEAMVGYDWLKKNVKKYPDLTISDGKKFAVRIHSDYAPDETLEDYGVSIDAYIEYQRLRPECKGVDANGDGKTDDGTLRDSIFQMIDSLPITSEAKDGLALMSYSAKSIRRNAPWH